MRLTSVGSKLRQGRLNPVEGILRSGTWVTIAVAVFLVAFAGSASANEKYAGLVMDAKTGRILYEDRADELRYPASLTKMMTLYLLFEELDSGRLSLDSQLKVSKEAASRPPSKLGLRPGQTIRVEDAIKALCVKSANDVAVVVAENISGSEAAFARKMTSKAHSLGMISTTFRTANGLPNSEQMTTAHDMARLGLALHDRFPRYFKYFGTRTFTWKGRTYRNTNHLLGKVNGMNGIKTGYTRASGFNLVTSVERDGRHIIAVVMGGRSGASRNSHMVDLIHRYLDDAKPGLRTAPMIVAHVQEPSRLPHARPTLAPTMAFASAASGISSGDSAQAAILAVSAPANRPAAPRQIASGYDPIAARIEEATEVARLAYASDAAGEDPIAALTRMADRRAAALGEPALHAAEGAADEEPLVSVRTRRGYSEPRLAPGGWHIQIGATPSEEGARTLLDKAKRNGGTVLASATPFTQPVEKSGETLYRARFAGFSGKNEARAACASLKRKSFSCLALPN